MKARVELHSVGFKGYVFREGRGLCDRSSEDTVFFVSPVGANNTECYVNFVTGPLDHETNALIMGALVKAGYTKAWMAVPSGKKCTRLSKFSHTENGLDWYYVEV